MLGAGDPSSVQSVSWTMGELLATKVIAETHEDLFYFVIFASFCCFICAKNR